MEERGYTLNHDTLRKLTLIEANSLPNVKLFPNPVGMATAGKTVKRLRGDGKPQTIFLEKNKTYALIENPRVVRYGLAKGSSDLIGFIETKIGSVTIPRFLGVEIKVGRDSLSAEQKNWQNMVNRKGGCAIVVKDSTADIVNQFGMPLRWV